MHPSSVLLVLLLLVLPTASPVDAREAPAPSASAPDSDATVSDPYGRSTPEGTVRGFIDALSSEDFDRAAVFLDLRDSSKGRKADVAAVARRFAEVLDRQGQFLPRAALSNAPAGATGDGLEPELDVIGHLQLTDERTDLLARRSEGPDGPIWLIQADGADALAGPEPRPVVTFVDGWIPAAVRERTLAGAPASHWISMLVVAAGAYCAAWLAVVLLGRLLALWRRVRRREAQTYVTVMGPPVRLLLALYLTTIIAPQLGISIVVRDVIGTPLQILGWGALAWLLLRAIDGMRLVILGKLMRGSRAQAATVVAFLGRVAKSLVLILSALAMLDTLGFDVTAAVTALGIGGIALALGAQKLIENFIGSILILADRPVRVGEFCKIGDVLGTVEEIGIRSTKIRTLENTVVVIPNSEFSVKQIENFSRRRKFWFHPILNLDCRTPPAKIEAFLLGVRELLTAVDDFEEPPRVRLLGIATDRLSVEIFGYVSTSDNDRFLEVQEAVTLQLLTLAARTGVAVAAPGVTVYTPNDPRTEQAPDRSAGASPRNED